MTKKHYIAVAAQFSQERTEADRIVDMHAYAFTITIIDNLQERIANVFAADNSRFDRTRFYAACEGQE